MLFFVIIVLIILLGLTAIISIGLLLEKKRAGRLNLRSEAEKPFVSIIIPARNEAENLPRLFESLEGQTNKNFELILIDDRSEDSSLELMRDFQKSTELQVKVISNTESPGTSNPKVKVLLKGLEHAEGNLYFFTDADCKAGKNWVSLLLDVFNDEKVGIVFGMLTLTEEDNALCRFQNFDHFYRMLYAFGASGLGVPVGCFGNNLAIRKETYLDTGGYEPLLHSATEDAELMSRVKEQGKYSIRALMDENTFIETMHKKTWAEHANQSSRWAAGAVFSTNRLAQAGFIALMVITAFCLLCLPLTIISPSFLIFPGIMYGFLYISAAVLGFAGSVNSSYWQGLPLSVLIYPFIYVISFFRTIITRTINWKGTIISWRKKK